jgi:hypothetical protein
LNETLIQHLESLPAEHLEVHVAAHPWFAAARVVLAKKKPSTDIFQQTIAYVNDRKWLKDYWEKKTTALEAHSPTIVFRRESEPASVESEQPVQSSSVGSETVSFVSESEQNGTVVADPLLDTARLTAEANQPLPPSDAEFTPVIKEVAKEHTFVEWLRAFTPLAPDETPLTAQQQPGKILSGKDELETLMYSHIPYEVIENKLETETNYAKGLSEFIAEQKQSKKQRMLAPNFDETTQLPVTETFARLLEKQGKTKQAIGIYEQLSLKFPQKSAYFASLIQRLKEKM